MTGSRQVVTTVILRKGWNVNNNNNNEEGYQKIEYFVDAVTTDGEGVQGWFSYDKLRDVTAKRLWYGKEGSLDEEIPKNVVKTRIQYTYLAHLDKACRHCEKNGVKYEGSNVLPQPRPWGIKELKTTLQNHFAYKNLKIYSLDRSWVTTIDKEAEKKKSYLLT